jgi:hypothetical protein
VKRFIRAGARLVAVDAITSVDCSRIEALEVTVHHRDGVDVASGPDAIDLAMALQPSVMEGRKLRFARHAFAVHNLLGHPLLQILVWLGARRAGLWVHDTTVPRPRGARESKGPLG